MSKELHSPTSSFAMEIASIPGGEDIRKCIQCGICSATCSVASVVDKYRPRKLIQKILIGERNEVLKDDLPWLCMMCRTCEDRCQEGASPVDIFHVVRQLAVKEGYIPDAFKQATKTVLLDGWMLEDAYSDFIEEDRENLNLDTNLEWNEEFTRRLMSKYFKGVI